MNGKMKRLLASLMLVAVAVSSLSGCALPAEARAKTKLTNHMTTTELERSGKTEFQLLNKPWEKDKTHDSKDFSYLKDKI